MRAREGSLRPQTEPRGWGVRIARGGCDGMESRKGEVVHSARLWAEAGKRV